MSKHSRWFCVTLIWVGLSLSSARAQEKCQHIFNDVGDKYALGPIALGTSQLKIMSRREAEDCYKQFKLETGIDDECAYVIESGIIYDINRVEPLERSTVGQARLDDYRSYSGPLIAGLELGDTMAVVRRKLDSLPRDFPQWHFNSWSTDRSSTLLTGWCLRSSKGALWSYALDFEDGRLTKVTATKDGYESSAW